MEGRVKVLNERIAREMGHGRKKNLIIFQIKKLSGESPRNPGVLREFLIKFLDEEVMKQSGWTDTRLKNAFRLHQGSENNPAPIIARFKSVEAAHLILANCKNLALLNSQRKKANGKTISIRRHLDPKSNGEIQYLNGMVKKMRLDPAWEGKQLLVIEQTDPELLVDGKRYKFNQLPQAWVKLVGPFNGF